MYDVLDKALELLRFSGFDLIQFDVVLLCFDDGFL